MDLGLKDCRALVLGGARGIGRGISDALAAEGVDLTIASRDKATVDSAVGEITKACGVKVDGRQVDLGEAASVDAFLADLGPHDILVLNGGGPPPGPVAAVPPDVWRAHFEKMVVAPIRVTQALLPGMRERQFGRIVIVLSSGVLQPLPNLGLSNSLRLSLVGWAKTLAREIAPDGVTINGIAPGRVQTDRIEQLDQQAAQREGKSIEDIRKASRATIPMGRLGTPAEFGALAAFLAGKPAAYMTGGVLRVDGGLVGSI